MDEDEMTFSPSKDGTPYRVRLHYAVWAGIWVGMGDRMSPACGQNGWIGTTNDPALVECKKCRATLAHRMEVPVLREDA